LLAVMCLLDSSPLSRHVTDCSMLLHQRCHFTTLIITELCSSPTLFFSMLLSTSDTVVSRYLQRYILRFQGSLHPWKNQTLYKYIYTGVCHVSEF
jgi:hypothetical protein